MTEGTPVARLSGVCFRYPGHARDLLANVNIVVRRGEVTVLCGPNGCGKSTLLGLLSGRLVPRIGRVEVLGKDPSAVSRAPEIGLVTEPFHPEQSPLPVDLTLGQVFSWIEIVDHVGRQEIYRAAQRLEVATEWHDQPLRLLSKGERQRVLLLTTLVRRPTLVLADEPLEGLDYTSRRLIGERLFRYAKDQGGAVVWVSHHLTETMAFADRLLAIETQSVTERPGDRYEVRFLSRDGQPVTSYVPSVDSIPNIIRDRLCEEPHVHVDIWDRNHQQVRQCGD